MGYGSLGNGSRENGEKTRVAEIPNQYASGLGLAGPVELVEDLLDRQLHAGEDRHVALGVGGRLRAPEFLHELEELRHRLPLEGHDELLVVDAERVPGVDLHARVAVADLEVAPHDAPA